MIANVDISFDPATNTCDVSHMNGALAVGIGHDGQAVEGLTGLNREPRIG